MFVMKVGSSLYYMSDDEETGETFYSSSKLTAHKFDTVEELAAVAEKYGIQGYSAGLEK